MLVTDIQAEMRRRGIDGWLVATFRGDNPIFADLTGITRPLTRRAFLWLPREGGATLLGSFVDGHALDTPAAWVGDREQYSGLVDLQRRLQSLLPAAGRIALEYTVDGANPPISRVDAGFVDWLRAAGQEVVSSGDLISLLTRWDAGQVADHEAAAVAVDRIRAEAFRTAFARAGSAQPVTEHELTDFILRQFAADGLTGGADVAKNAHAADPHYVPAATPPVPILPGDTILIDLWGRRSGPRSPYADSTWMGFAGDAPPSDLADAFAATRDARNAGIRLLEEAWRAGRPLRGREVDRAVRNVLAERGYGAQFSHRTGHSLGWHHVHGDGANLDDFEFPDDRLLAPVSGVTIEPGVYLAGRFGVRLEVSVLLTGDGPRLTTALQEEITLP